MPLLDVMDCTKRFGGLTAVSSFSLTLEQGEIVGLIGPNGAGKTTAFNLLTGVYTPTSGQILWNGQNIAGKRPFQIARCGISRTFQNIRLFPTLTVLENVLAAYHLHYKPHMWEAVLRTPHFVNTEQKTRNDALELLDRFHLSQSANELSKNLAYGEQRRLEIARALATSPKLLLLDEPAAGMNPQEKQELMAQIRSLRDDFGLTILFIEHDMRVVMGVCERLMVLDYGQTIARGTPEEIRSNPKVIEAYLGEAVAA